MYSSIIKKYNRQESWKPEDPAGGTGRGAAVDQQEPVSIDIGELIGQMNPVTNVAVKPLALAMGI